MGVDTWNSTPNTIEGGGWKPDNDGVAVDGWAPDNTGADENDFSGEFKQENISKHDDGFDGPADGGCRICGEEGHFARDCASKPANSGLCYRCGEPGHNKGDCINEPVEREFTGTCRICQQEGHKASACPEKPAEKCKICGDEEHAAAECTANRVFFEFANLGIKQMSAGEAWNEIVEADDEKDAGDMKKAILQYAKAYPEVTFPEIEAVFRESNMNTYLIAKKQEVSDTHTIVNLQGKIDQAYALSIQLSAKPRRVKFAEGWPESAEENMVRLAEAGFIMDRMVPKCGNCGEMGHGSRQCKEEKTEREKPTVTCALCNETGHYARDCQEPRKVRGSRSCDERGHMSKECPKPTDWSRVVCKNCGNKGHGAKRCPEPPKEEDEDAGGDAAGAGDAAGGWDGGADASGG